MVKLWQFWVYFIIIIGLDLTVFYDLCEVGSCYDWLDKIVNSEFDFNIIISLLTGI